MDEKLSPGFSISHTLDRSFPSREDFSRFGYEPFDVFLTTDIDPEGSLDTRISLGSDSIHDLVENLSADIFMIFRYRKQGSNDLPHEISESIDEIPTFKSEAAPASLQPDRDFYILEEILADTHEDLIDADYMYSSNPSAANPEGCKNIGDYLHGLEGQELTVWPDTYGVNELEIQPKNLSVSMKLYRQEVFVERSGSGFKNYSGENPRQETVRLNYNESAINEIEESLEKQGFEVAIEYLPKTVSPPDI